MTDFSLENDGCFGLNMLLPRSLFDPDEQTAADEPSSLLTVVPDDPLPAIHARLAKAIMNNESFSTIRLLSKHDSRVVSMVDKDGMTLLHLACMYNASVPVVEYLAQAFPRALSMVDRYDLYPLHTAIKYKASLELIQFLVLTYPETCRLANFLGCTALHGACSYGSSLSIIRLLLQHYPEAVFTVNRVEETPLHCACKAYGASIEVIRLLVRLAPDTIGATDLRGNTPFHCCCEWEASRKVLQLLSDSCPESLKMNIERANKDGNTPLHLICKYSERFNDSIVEYVTNQSPGSCLILNNAGYLPWTLVCDDSHQTMERISPAVSLQLRRVTRAATKALADAVVTHSLPKSVTRHMIATIRGTGSACHANNDHPTIWSLKIAMDILNHQELQKLLKTIQYHALLNGLVRMNEAGRGHIRDDPGNKMKGIFVLASTDNLDCLYQHVRDIPSLCESASGDHTVVL